VAIVLILTSTLPFVTLVGVQPFGGLVRPVVEYASAIDGSAPGISPSFEPPEGSGWSPLGPTSGTIKLAVIAVQFQDVHHIRTIDEIRQDYFGLNNSLAEYYREVSYGKFRVTGDVFGWYTLPYPESHYGKNCLGINDADCSGSDGSWQVAQDAVNAMNKSVNFQKYDYFAFVHSGNGQESSKESDDVWSVTYVSGVDIVTPSRTLFAFNVVAEREARGRVPLGVYCAEFGHLLGVPDMFNTATGSSEMGPWELEEAGTWNGQPGGSSPAEMSSWDRLKIGWLTQDNEEFLSQSTSAINTLNPLESPEGIRAAKIISSDSYYLLEVRRPIGFDRGLPGFGVIAYEVTNSDAAAPYRKVAGLTTAFGAGYVYVGNDTGTNSSDVSFKVFNRFANGTYLIGFGPSSFIEGNILTVELQPAASNATIIVNGAAYSTDENGMLTVVNLDGTGRFNVTVPTIASLGAGSRELFDRWSNGLNSTTINLPNGNGTITANYQLQYLITVNSLYGSPVGAGWYNQGTNASVTLPNAVNGTQSGTRYLFAGWAGDFNGTSNPMNFEVETPINLTANWTTQYYLDIDTGGHAIASGSGWYDVGSNVSYSVTPPNAANGAWYIFQGWTGDGTNSELSGCVTITRPMTMLAKWAVLDWMKFAFKDAAGEPVISSRNLSGYLLASNGTLIQFDQSTSSGLWLANGTYQVSDVSVLGMKVSVDGQSFATTPNGDVVVYLELFNITIQARDVITTQPLSGAVVTITLPNGSNESNVTGPDGTATFQQLPMSSYPYKVNGNWLLPSTGNATMSSAGSINLDVRLVNLPTLFALVMSIVALATILVALLRRYSGRKTVTSMRTSKRSEPFV